MISQAFEYTGATQKWTVPQGISTITVEVWGAQGYNPSPASAPAGAGGYVKADVNVTPGVEYTIFVGRAGQRNAVTPAFGFGTGGIGGNQRSTTNENGGGGGGGSAFVRQTGPPSEVGIPYEIYVVAGAGGGAQNGGVTGGDAPRFGAHGGGTAKGEDGGTLQNSLTTHGKGGSSATASAVGAGGQGGGSAESGLSGQGRHGGRGGNGTPNTYHMASGGGGGGFFGGGGGGGGQGTAPYPRSASDPFPQWGVGGSGGGGSSFAAHADVVAGTVTMTPGVRAGNGRVIVSYKELAPSVPTNLTPAAGSVLNIANPTLGAVFTVGSLQARAKVEWTLAQDAAFTQDVRVYTQPDSALQNSPVSSAAYLVGSQASDQLLSQGTWYIRARTIDENGSVSGYSGTQSFRVEYPPSTINHYPTGNIAIGFIASGNVFAWDFISPSPNNDQIAYQVVVETNAGVLIFDSGRVESINTETTVNIPAARKGDQLRWRVRVWDSDNIQGPYSQYQLFRVVDGPTVEIDDVDTVPTANPTFTFNATPTVNTQITQKRLYITRDSDGAIVYDSGWVN